MASAFASVIGGLTTKQLNQTRSATSTAASSRRSRRLDRPGSARTIQVAAPATRTPTVTSTASRTRTAVVNGYWICNRRSSWGPIAHSNRHSVAITANGAQVTTTSALPPPAHRRRMDVVGRGDRSSSSVSSRWTHQASSIAREKSTSRRLRESRRSEEMPGIA